MSFRNFTTVMLLGLCLISFLALNSHAQSSVNLDYVIGEYPGDPSKLECDPCGPVEFHLRIDNQSGGFVTGLVNGLRMWSPDGASIDLSQSEWNPAIDWNQYWDGGRFINYFHGASGDTAGFGAFTIFSSGYPTNHSNVAFIVRMAISCSDAGKTVCLDSSFFPPGGGWFWSTTVGNVIPTWDGPHCWMIDMIPCLRPEWVSYPTETLEFNCYDSASMTFEANDPMGGSLVYRQLSGPGQIDSITGVWTYLPQIGDVGQTHSVTVTALDPGICYPACPVTAHFTVTNLGPPPQLTSGCHQYMPVLDSVAEIQMSCDHSSCGQLEYGIFSAEPSSVGIHVDPVTGLVQCFSDSIMTDTLYDITISVTDGCGFDTCYVWFMKGTCQIPGNMNHLGDVNISDMLYLVGYLFDGGTPPPSFEEADVNGSGFIDISDLTYFVDFMFGGGPAPVPCP